MPTNSDFYPSKINSRTNTAAEAPAATMIRLFFMKASTRAAANPASADQTELVAVRIAGNVMAASVA